MEKAAVMKVASRMFDHPVQQVPGAGRYPPPEESSVGDVEVAANRGLGDLQCPCSLGIIEHPA